LPAIDWENPLKFSRLLRLNIATGEEVRNPTATDGKLEYRLSESASRANAATSIALFRQILLAIVSEVSLGDVAVIIHTLK
jgi:hypothetical protein